MNKPLVLVTGGSGFIAVHIIVKLLQQGFRVRTTLRNMGRQEEVKAMVKHGGVTDVTDLEFLQAELLSDDRWDSAAQGATYVIHVASPTPATRPADGAAMVAMAVEGTLRVMKAAKAAGVKRVVLTSASGAVISGHRSHREIFTENDWTNLSANIDAYQRSKTMAELAAWEFAKKEALELSVINPVAVLGPILGTDYSHSNQIIKAMLTGKMPFLLKIGFDCVDVRDVADLHLLAMTHPKAAGERFLATSGENLTYKEEAKILRQTLGQAADRVSTRELPDVVIKLIALFKKDLRMPATFLGQNTACSNEKAKAILGWQPRSATEAIVETATSLIRFGLLDS